MYTILLSGEGGLSQLPILSFRWSSARTLGSHPNFLHFIAERGGLSQLPILSFRWSSARTMGSHPNFLHFIAERGGFEPPLRYRKHAFQACAFNRSATSPNFKFAKISNLE